MDVACTTSDVTRDPSGQSAQNLVSRRQRHTERSARVAAVRRRRSRRAGPGRRRRATGSLQRTKPADQTADVGRDAAGLGTIQLVDREGQDGASRSPASHDLAVERGVGLAAVSGAKVHGPRTAGGDHDRASRRRSSTPLERSRPCRVVGDRTRRPFENSRLIRVARAIVGTPAASAAIAKDGKRAPSEKCMTTRA